MEHIESHREIDEGRHQVGACQATREAKHPSRQKRYTRTASTNILEEQVEQRSIKREAGPEMPTVNSIPVKDLKEGSQVTKCSH